MYGHINHPLMSYGAEDFSGHLPPPTGEDFDPMAAVGAAKSEVGYTSSGCSSYGSPSSLTSSHFSAPSSSSSLMQRSVSSHSLQKNICGFPQLAPASLLADFIDSETCPVRKVFSTGDLQRINYVGQHYHRSNSPLSNENSTSIIEGMSRACRYSPEEKKERIERYKSKRSHRNFNKKIQYACRKTLADSRPRIRGRFARNDEIEKSRSQSLWNQHAGAVEEDDDDIDDNWINLLDLFSANLIP